MKEKYWFINKLNMLINKSILKYYYTCVQTFIFSEICYSCNKNVYHILDNTPCIKKEFSKY